LGYFSDLNTIIYVLFNDRYLFEIDRRYHSSVSNKLLIKIPPYTDFSDIYSNPNNEVSIKIGYGSANKFLKSVKLKFDLTKDCE
jgi:hypothetical protein